MLIGILKEMKAEENRVSMTPAGVEVMKQNGHGVLVQRGAGKGSGFEDDAYDDVGAEIIDRAEDIFKRADMIIRVKEPIAQEYDLIQEDQIIFTYLHLAAARDLTLELIRRSSVNIAYETIQRADGSLPLLIPMSEVAGRMAIQEAAKYLERSEGGNGVLLAGVPGVDPGTVGIIGGGIVGMNAAKMACGMGAKVYILDMNLDRLRYLSDVMPRNCFLLVSTPSNVRSIISESDAVIGAVLVPGAKAPKIIGESMLKIMKKGAVLVDVAIDQGGCSETSVPTTHSSPTYIVEDVIHYCVANMPGALPRTSTVALTNATLPYALEIANKGWKRAMKENSEIKSGANIVKGRVTCKPVADAFGLDYTPVDSLLGSPFRNTRKDARFTKANKETEYCS